MMTPEAADAERQKQNQENKRRAASERARAESDARGANSGKAEAAPDHVGAWVDEASAAAGVTYSPLDFASYLASCVFCLACMIGGITIAVGQQTWLSAVAKQYGPNFLLIAWPVIEWSGTVAIAAILARGAQKGIGRILDEIAWREIGQLCLIAAGNYFASALLYFVFPSFENGPDLFDTFLRLVGALVEGGLSLLLLSGIAYGNFEAVKTIIGEKKRQADGAAREIANEREKRAREEEERRLEPLKRAAKEAEERARAAAREAAARAFEEAARAKLPVDLLTRASAKTPQESAALYAGNAIWQTNGGIYLGCKVDDPDAKEKFPLQKRRKLPHVSANSPVKSHWHYNGELVEFSGVQHVVSFGRNGSGKSRKLLLPNLLKLGDWSIAVVDPKGELCAHTALHRSRGENHKVFVFDPFGVMPERYPHLCAKYPELFKSHGLNVLAAIKSKSDSFADDAADVAASLVKPEKEHDKYWSMAAQGLIEGLILAAKVDKFGEQANLNDIRRILSNPPETLAEFCVERVEQLGKDNPEMVARLGEFTKHRGDDRENNGVRRLAKVYTNWMGSAPMQRSLEGGTFDPTMMKKTPTTVYLVVPTKQLTKKAVWLRMMITSLLMPLLDSAEIKAGQVPVLFMLDEFAQLGHMEIIKETYAALRGYGVKLWTIWQGVNQASDLYGGEWWKTFPSQAGAVQSFATANDGDTAEYFSHFYGEREKERKTQSRTRARTSTKGKTSGSGGGNAHHE